MRTFACGSHFSARSEYTVPMAPSTVTCLENCSGLRVSDFAIDARMPMTVTVWVGCGCGACCACACQDTPTRASVTADTNGVCLIFISFTPPRERRWDDATV